MNDPRPKGLQQLMLTSDLYQGGHWMMLTNDLYRRHHQQQRVAVRREELARNERKRNRNTSIRSTRKVAEEC